MISDPIDTETRKELVNEFTCVVNRLSLENHSNTPDFLLGEYLVQCLEAYNKLAYNRMSYFNEER